MDLFRELDRVVEPEDHHRDLHLDAADHRSRDAGLPARAGLRRALLQPRPRRCPSSRSCGRSSASDDTIEAVTAFVLACGKEPIEVKDQAGFIVNALLFPYLNNAVRLLEQGVATKEGIDAAMKGGCGFPMGPFALLDLVGLDTSLAILDALYAEYADAELRARCRCCAGW